MPVLFLCYHPTVFKHRIENDVQFVVELNKLLIRAGKAAQIDCDRDLPKMVTDYLRLHPHVSYLGAGINYETIDTVLMSADRLCSVREWITV
jgi:hypothetical protein